MFMAVKTITVTEEAYKALANEKKKDESFSEVILRTHKRGNIEDIMKFAGAWSDMGDEEAEQIKKRIGKMSKRAMKNVARKVRGI